MFIRVSAFSALLCFTAYAAPVTEFGEDDTCEAPEQTTTEISPIVNPTASTLSSIATPTGTTSTASTLPFTLLVAYGDELSDNGNGSYAHGITGSPANVYGFGTWTNGPVAVSYLADLLSVPLIDYAFGADNGGSGFGATVDTAYTVSPAGAPGVKQQIANYTSSGAKGIKESLQLIWIGENDLSEHTDAFWLTDPANSYFASNISSRIAAEVSTLLDAGAPTVFVANIYPKHIAPVTTTYLCGTNTDCVTTWGQVIEQANSAIESSLTQFGEKVIYYDVFNFMVNLANNAAQYGITQPNYYYCDGDPNSPDDHWNDCMIEGHANEYYWMSFVNPTTHVHQLIAEDMKAAVDKHFAS